MGNARDEMNLSVLFIWIVRFFEEDHPIRITRFYSVSKNVNVMEFRIDFTDLIRRITKFSPVMPNKMQGFKYRNYERNNPVQRWPQIFYFQKISHGDVSLQFSYICVYGWTIDSSDWNWKHVSRFCLTVMIEIKRDTEMLKKRNYQRM